jgi:hypothetical protein
MEPWSEESSGADGTGAADDPFRDSLAGLSESSNPLSATEQWHDLLSTRYVCERCLTRYFRSYRKCKACGEVGRIRTLTTGLFDLADDDGELREMIARGQRVMGFGDVQDLNEAGPPVDSDSNR